MLEFANISLVLRRAVLFGLLIIRTEYVHAGNGNVEPVRRR